LLINKAATRRFNWKNTMTTGALRVTSLNPSSQIASSAIQFFNNVESGADQLISALPNMADEQVWQLRVQARVYGRVSWRIECACDAEIMNRESVRRGRGVRDTEERGVTAAVIKHAAELGVAPKTIFRNASVHKTFFNSDSAVTNKEKNGSLDILEEKDFYLAALATDDPWATIEKYAQEKLKNPFFSTRDAWRMTKEDKTPPLDETVPALCDQEDVLAAWEELQIAFRKMVSAAPRLQNLIGGYREEIQYELTLPSQTVEETIYELIRQGYDEADQIAARMKRDRIYVQVWLNRLCEIGKLGSFEKERAPGARGQARTGYREIDS
jgi:hypothetical protein